MSNSNYYCYHCGCKSFNSDWICGRCPKCNASTPPVGDKKTFDSGYYCYHCGLKTAKSYWSYGRCPKCNASTSPSKW